MDSYVYVEAARFLACCLLAGAIAGALYALIRG